MDLDNRYKIYIVDDDEMFLEVLDNYLNQNLQQLLSISTFSSGKECLEEVEKGYPDIIFLDYFLDSEDEEADNGIEILQKIKAINPDLMVIMLTRNSDPDSIVQAIKNGAYDYIYKGESVYLQVRNIINNVISQKTLANNNKDWLDRINILKYLFGGFLIIGLLLLIFTTTPPILPFVFALAAAAFIYLRLRTERLRYQVTVSYLGRLHTHNEEDINHSFKMLCYQITPLQKNRQLFDQVVRDLKHQNVISKSKGTEVYYDSKNHNTDPLSEDIEMQGLMNAKLKKISHSPGLLGD